MLKIFCFKSYPSFVFLAFVGGTSSKAVLDLCMIDLAENVLWSGEECTNNNKENLAFVTNYTNCILGNEIA